MEKTYRFPVSRMDKVSFVDFSTTRHQTSTHVEMHTAQASVTCSGPGLVRVSMSDGYVELTISSSVGVSSLMSDGVILVQPEANESTYSPSCCALINSNLPFPSNLRNPVWLVQLTPAQFALIIPYRTLAENPRVTMRVQGGTRDMSKFLMLHADVTAAKLSTQALSGGLMRLHPTTVKLVHAAWERRTKVNSRLKLVDGDNHPTVEYESLVVCLEQHRVRHQAGGAHAVFTVPPEGEAADSIILQALPFLPSDTQFITSDKKLRDMWRFLNGSAQPMVVEDIIPECARLPVPATNPSRRIEAASAPSIAGPGVLRSSTIQDQVAQLSAGYSGVRGSQLQLPGVASAMKPVVQVPGVGTVSMAGATRALDEAGSISYAREALGKLPDTEVHKILQAGGSGLTTLELGLIRAIANGKSDALLLAKYSQLTTKKDVNPTLYDMQKRGLISNQNEGGRANWVATPKGLKLAVLQVGPEQLTPWRLRLLDLCKQEAPEITEAFAAEHPDRVTEMVGAGLLEQGAGHLIITKAGRKALADGVMRCEQASSTPEGVAAAAVLQRYENEQRSLGSGQTRMPPADVVAAAKVLAGASSADDILGAEVKQAQVKCQQLSDLVQKRGEAYEGYLERLMEEINIYTPKIQAWLDQGNIKPEDWAYINSVKTVCEKSKLSILEAGGSSVWTSLALDTLENLLDQINSHPNYKAGTPPSATKTQWGSEDLEPAEEPRFEGDALDTELRHESMYLLQTGQISVCDEALKARMLDFTQSGASLEEFKRRYAMNKDTYAGTLKSLRTNAFFTKWWERQSAATPVAEVQQPVAAVASAGTASVLDMLKDDFAKLDFTGCNMEIGTGVPEDLDDEECSDAGSDVSVPVATPWENDYQLAVHGSLGARFVNGDDSKPCSRLMLPAMALQQAEWACLGWSSIPGVFEIRGILTTSAVVSDACENGVMLCAPVDGEIWNLGVALVSVVYRFTAGLNDHTKAHLAARGVHVDQSASQYDCIISFATVPSFMCNQTGWRFSVLDKAAIQAGRPLLNGPVLEGLPAGDGPTLLPLRAAHQRITMTYICPGFDQEITYGSVPVHHSWTAGQLQMDGCLVGTGDLFLLNVEMLALKLLGSRGFACSSTIAPICASFGPCDLDILITSEEFQVQSSGQAIKVTPSPKSLQQLRSDVGDIQPAASFWQHQQIPMVRWEYAWNTRWDETRGRNNRPE